ncbi:WXG100 family type VII secretion target [Streptacidiphilus sp. PB12-B1b]|uniref:WXG100 family type VII secretion target n=1 Tax=Streptacidiphilus sp. PB12-B1b TaxID=2705012 RepID=UPI0015F8C639|nr:WXG100 family type VII secretion target [Streptacidiphilus sp. PB12-B1b]QMU77119.1 WXG100 family type VII secretion target [Streptacidiphilus sp. PB12-B1b]
MSTDYNNNGFNQGDDGAVFGDPGSDPGSVSDYNTWDWKQIMAAINGMSAGVDNSDNDTHALSVSDPSTLQTAADAFYTVQLTLSQIAQSLQDQANALAGPHGPWTGDAADSFIDMMTTFSKQVSATANVLSGGATGTDSVPQQLADNSVNLRTAQNKLVEIDNWYANQAIEMGVQPMSNGLIPISQKPQLVEMMTSDMRAVLKSLAGEYQVTIDTVRSPQPINSPGDNSPNDPNDPGLNDPDTGTGPTDDMPLSPVTSDLPRDAEADPSPFPGDLSTSDAAGLPDSGLDPASLDAALNPGGSADPSPFPGGTGVSDLAALPGDGTGVGDPSAFPDGTGVGGADPDPLGSTDPLGALSPSSFPGGTGVGTGVGALPLGTEDDVTDPLADDTGESFPGGLGTGGVGGLPGTADDLSTDGAGSPAAFPGGLSTESGVPDGLGTGVPLDTGVPGADGLGSLSGTGVGDTSSDAASDGMPYMPGAGGAAGQPGAGDERSDASGLLDGDVAPWEGSTDVGDGDIGSPLGTAAGGSGLDGLGDLGADGLGKDGQGADGLGTGLPGADGLGALGGVGAGDTGADAAGDGMPYMPGAGGAPGQSGDPSGERSDASGLLDGDIAPWEGEPDLDEEVGSPLGTTAGGSGLDGLGGLGDLGAGSPGADGLGADGLGAGGADADGPGSDVPAAESGGSSAGDGMPYLPGAGGAPGQGGSDGERSDASGLLEGETDPWQGEPGTADEVGSALGAVAGAASLGLLAAGAVAAAATAAQHEEPPALARAEAAAWTDLPEGVEATAEAVPSSAPNAGSSALLEEEGEPLADEQGALAGQAEGEGAEESAAWDTAGEALVPLLWGLVGGEEERDVLSSGYSGAEDGTWTGQPAGAEAPIAEGEPDGPGWATWQPNRAPAPGGLTERALAATSALSASCSAEAVAEEPELQEPDEPEEPAPVRSIADLLVQDGDTWGGGGAAEDADAFL